MSRQTKVVFGAILAVVGAVTTNTGALRADVTVQIEDFEFAVTDEAAAAGVTDITDWENQPTFYINGEGGDEGGASEGLYALGTDAMFGASGIFVPGSFIGCLREISTDLFPSGQVTLLRSYGDPDVPGPLPADSPLSDLVILADAYGGEAFGEGLTGTHLWINLLDAEGERFNFVNYTELSLFLEDYTLDVVVGQGMVRIDPDSLIEVPDGDRLLTEIVAFEMLIQDDDDPPTGQGKWYIDNLRIVEVDLISIPGDADGDGDVDIQDFDSYLVCVTGAGGGPPGTECETFDLDDDLDVDFSDFAILQALFTGGT